ncbi:MAG: YecA family protein [Gammaproteobacteria bacterium]
MNSKTGRNAPCPCGSGRKFKACHGREDEVAVDTPAAAVERAVKWMLDRHHDAYMDAIEAMAYDVLWPDDGPAPEDADEDAITRLFANLDEWMVAHGEVELSDRIRNVNELVLSHRGPALTPVQRHLVAALRTSPLRPYRVSKIRTGEGVTLQDALDPGAEPVFVHTRIVPEHSLRGGIVGCRVMEVDGRRVAGEALYGFPADTVEAVLGTLRFVARMNVYPSRLNPEIEIAIAGGWLRLQVLRPEPGEFLDDATGEPTVYVTDRYEIVDPARLRAAIDACPDLRSDTVGGWYRARSVEAPETFVCAHLQPGEAAGEFELFYRTRRMAEEGRVWFEALAGEAVTHLGRDVNEPRGPVPEPLED